MIQFDDVTYLSFMLFMHLGTVEVRSEPQSTERPIIGTDYIP